MAVRLSQRVTSARHEVVRQYGKKMSPPAHSLCFISNPLMFSHSDAKRVVEIDPSNKQAASIVRRLEPKVEERREKLKEEMFGESRGGKQLAA